MPPGSVPEGTEVCSASRENGCRQGRGDGLCDLNETAEPGTAGRQFDRADPAAGLAITILGCETWKQKPPALPVVFRMMCTGSCCSKRPGHRQGMTLKGSVDRCRSA